jgi:hypothetical protein
MDAFRGMGHAPCRPLPPRKEDDAERLPRRREAKPPGAARSAFGPAFRGSPEARPARGPRRSRRHPTSALAPDPPPSCAWDRRTGIVRGQPTAIPSADTPWAGGTEFQCPWNGLEPTLPTLQEQHRKSPHLPSRGLRPRATVLGYADLLQRAALTGAPLDPRI